MNIIQKLRPSAVVAFVVDKDRPARVGIKADLLVIRTDVMPSEFPARRLFLPVTSLRSRVSGRLLKGGGGRYHLKESMNAEMRAKVLRRSSRPSRSWLTSFQSPTAFRPNVDSAMPC